MYALRMLPKSWFGDCTFYASKLNGSYEHSHTYHSSLKRLYLPMDHVNEVHDSQKVYVRFE